MTEIKDMIIDKFGGVGIVANICGITPGAVSQWTIIPASHQQTLLNAARKDGIDLRPQHFFEAHVNGKRKG